MSASTVLPFDPRLMHLGPQPCSFEESIFDLLSLEDRERWSQSPMLSTLCLFQSGYFKRAIGHSVERRNLEQSVLIYCTAGKGIYRTRGMALQILPGDLLCCPAHAHYGYESDARDPWTIHWLHLTGESFALLCKLIGLTPECPVVQLGLRPEIVELFAALHPLFQPQCDNAHLAALHAAAQHLLAQIALVHTPRPDSACWQQEMHAVMRYMEDSVEKKLQLEDFATFAGLSRFHFARRFKLTTGLAPMHYFMHLKIKKACLLLESSSLTLKAISSQLGFENEYYFSRCFKSYMGCSPLNYCKNQ